MNPAEQKNRSLKLELLIVTATLLVIVRAFFLARGNAIIGQALSAIVAILFLYAPIIVLWFRKRSIDFLDRGKNEYLRSIAAFAVSAAVIFPLFLLAAHGWQKIVIGEGPFHFAGFPNFLNVVLFQLLLVSLPEEFYFRGYFQSTMNLIFPRKWRVFGANLGWGFIITALVFAVAHSIVFYKWWHFSIFFPALVFGYLRERTGSITAPILFHAASNILMDWFVRCYI